ncbi:polyprenyl synthetase family protein [Streptomyces sp. NPDC005180]|uniref:polyprenyl synthetase family protein n=1 Tax=Streptomyces sp. NPDC005180 TaxID=3156868 RepID=UPI0033A47B42
MKSPTLAATPTALRSIGRQVDVVLAAFVDARARGAVAHGFPAEIAETLRGFLFAGGKRLRPQLCVIGWQTAGEGPVPAPVVQAAASLEMFHAFALIHDDVMDDSASRRGRPTVHRSLAAHHAGRPDAERLGVNAAILVGDLALAWSDELLHTAGLTPVQLAAAHEVVDAMRTELMYGQYLDLCATGQGGSDVEAALRTARYKTGRYTVERPLLLGAALAGAGKCVREALSAYALPVGEAFQLRDDLLGVFGSPEMTGKPAVDDLREGKHTVLVALALQRATPRQRHILHTLLGDPGLGETGADRIRQVLTATGARDEVENLIDARRAQALHVLDTAPFPPGAIAGLRQLADTATARTS